MAGRRIRLEPNGTVFEAAESEAVLNAALRQGVPLRYGCRHGNCSSCKYLVSDGDVDLGNASPYSLSEREREEGWALLCCARALSDLVIQVPEDPTDRLRPVLRPADFAATVAANDRVTRALHRLRLRLDRPLAFYPGQFLEVEVPGRPGEWRSYSIASSPSRSAEVDLVILKVPGGAFSASLERLGGGAALRVRGPYGTSYLREGDRPILLVGGGSGIAPLLSILEFAAEAGDRRAITFFYGARTAADLPLQEEIAELQRRLPHLRYRPALSEPTADCRWAGAVGLIAQVIQRELADASPFDAYVCGPPPMCDTVSLILAAKGLPDGRAFLDRFYSAVESPGSSEPRARSFG
ncbi:MAG: 2Fe-2S iron-sulfur cluster binding domain-containing protein [Deltaproteobacteria bacterium]|nr:2Fe-2S iron-sulfur cluster binding domain-containing protein [Deltaproteobacteria bacterium]